MHAAGTPTKTKLKTCNDMSNEHVTRQNRRFSSVLGGYKKGTPGSNGLNDFKQELGVS